MILPIGPQRQRQSILLKLFDDDKITAGRDMRGLYSRLSGVVVLDLGRFCWFTLHLVQIFFLSERGEETLESRPSLLKGMTFLNR